ncbi:MAG: ABC transporter permease [Vicinamibacteria bacterium]
MNDLARRAVAELAAVPGVDSAAMVLSLPYELWLNIPFRIEGANDEARVTSLTYATSDYFRVARIPISYGRAFGDTDDARSHRVVVVSESFVARYLRDREPLGARIVLDEGPSWEIVGVARDVQQQPSWGTRAPLTETLPAAYVPISQTGDSFLQLVHVWFAPRFVVRTTGTGADSLRAIGEAAAKLDPLLPVAEFRPLTEIQGSALSQERFLAALVSAFAGLAAVLAGVGIYGLVATTVEQRRRELSIRIAVGSTAPQALADAMRPSILLALAGVAAGIGIAMGMSRFLSSLVWGVGSTDPATFLAVGLGTLVLAAVASSIPALRVLRLDPVRSLREE